MCQPITANSDWMNTKVWSKLSHYLPLGLSPNDYAYPAKLPFTKTFHPPIVLPLLNWSCDNCWSQISGTKLRSASPVASFTWTMLCCFCVSKILSKLYSFSTQAVLHGAMMTLSLFVFCVTSYLARYLSLSTRLFRNQSCELLMLLLCGHVRHL